MSEPSSSPSSSPLQDRTPTIGMLRARVAEKHKKVEALMLASLPMSMDDVEAENVELNRQLELLKAEQERLNDHLNYSTRNVFEEREKTEENINLMKKKIRALMMREMFLKGLKDVNHDRLSSSSSLDPIKNDDEEDVDPDVPDDGDNDKETLIELFDSFTDELQSEVSDLKDELRSTKVAVKRESLLRQESERGLEKARRENDEMAKQLKEGRKEEEEAVEEEKVSSTGNTSSRNNWWGGKKKQNKGDKKKPTKKKKGFLDGFVKSVLGATTSIINAIFFRRTTQETKLLCGLRELGMEEEAFRARKEQRRLVQEKVKEINAKKKAEESKGKKKKKKIKGRFAQAREQQQRLVQEKMKEMKTKEEEVTFTRQSWITFRDSWNVQYRLFSEVNLTD